MSRKTPLFEAHVSLGARMTEFAGFEMPIQYSGIVDEHLAVRSAVGIFDVSHMGEFVARGEGAFDFIQSMVTNDVGRLEDGQALYTVMCFEDGGIVDDLLVYRISEDHYFLVVNAANIEKDFAWLASRVPPDCELLNISDEMALLAVQGPNSQTVVEAALGVDLSGLEFYHFRPSGTGSVLRGDYAFISRTGYTGEHGYELYCSNESAVPVWGSVMESGDVNGIKPIGLGARDTLRMEAGFCLYGNDITDRTNPYEAGLGWVTKLKKGHFLGRDALVQVKENRPSRRLVGFVLEERGIPRPGYPILDERGDEIGQVTSGTQSPVLQKGIGLGYVPNKLEFRQPGSQIWIGVRSKRLKAMVKKPPLHLS